jgi:hypothetical protein
MTESLKKLIAARIVALSIPTCPPLTADYRRCAVDRVAVGVTEIVVDKVADSIAASVYCFSPACPKIMILEVSDFS